MTVLYSRPFVDVTYDFALEDYGQKKLYGRRSNLGGKDAVVDINTKKPLILDPGLMLKSSLPAETQYEAALLANRDGTLHCYEADTGKLRWRNKSASGESSCASQDGQRLLLFDSDFRVTAVDETSGGLLWRREWQSPGQSMKLLRVVSRSFDANRDEEDDVLLMLSCTPLSSPASYSIGGDDGLDLAKMRLSVIGRKDFELTEELLDKWHIAATHSNDETITLGWQRIIVLDSISGKSIWERENMTWNRYHVADVTGDGHNEIVEWSRRGIAILDPQSGDTIRPVVEVRRPIGNEAWGVVYDHGRAIGVSGVIFDTQGRSNHPLGSFRSQALSLVRFEDGSFSATDELFYPLVIRNMNQDGSTEFVGQLRSGTSVKLSCLDLNFQAIWEIDLNESSSPMQGRVVRAPQINHECARIGVGVYR